jgi:Ca-activated chloride channel family protein
MPYPEAACLKSRDGAPVLLQGVRAEGDLRGVLLEMTVEQTFSNPTATSMEVVYSFPLPWGAVLLSVDVLLGSQRLSGAVVEKTAAEARYEEALSGGNAAIMLEKNHDGSYSLNLGNLAASETCVVTLRYAQVLPYAQRGLRLMIPTVIAPRYGDAAQAGLQPHQAPESDLLADYPFDVVVRLHGDLAQARVATPNHPAAMSIRDGVLTVTLARRGALDRDFVLVADELPGDALGMQAFDAVAGGSVAVMASFCPRIPAEGATPLAVKMLVDCSGSMAGDSIDAARRALQAVVLQLSPSDRFALSRFGSTVSHRARGLWSVSDATRLAAQRWVGALEADMGGTDMEDALTSTFALGGGAGIDVLLVTDGEIHAIDSTVAAAKASGHRLFIVGVGTSPAESHLRRLAEATGGACDFVTAGEAVEPAVLRMFARLRSPRLTDVRVVWPGKTKPVWVSPVTASVFDADTVNVFALMPAPLSGAVTLRGKREDGSAVDIGHVDFGQPPADEPLLARVVASTRIAASLAAKAPSRRGAKATLLAADIAMAVEYQLVTAGTNFLLVHVRSAEDRALDMPELHRVAQMVPAGWGGTGRVANDSVDFLSINAAPTAQFSVMRSPRTAGMAPRQAYAGGGADLAASSSMTSYEDLALSEGTEPPTDGPATPRRFIDEGDDQGLTPFGVHDWLRSHAEETWPSTFSSLQAIGVGKWVLEWLELGLGASMDEGLVVRTFLQVMFEQQLHASSGRINLFGVVKRLSQSLRFMPVSSEERVSNKARVQLAERLVKTLHGVTAERWPDVIYAMEA